MSDKPIAAVPIACLQSPPYPKTRNRGARFYLDWDRVHQSSTWILCPPELRGQLLLLWFTAWTSYPMGSLPNEDAVIATAIGMSPVHFRNHREVLMRGFRLCSDGRFYHSVIDEQVNEHLEYKARKSKAQSKYYQRVKKDSDGQ